MKNSIIIIILFAAGITISYFKILPENITQIDISYYALLLLMFMVGLTTGADSETFKVLKKAKLNILMTPIAAIIGTWLGVSIVSTMLPTISLTESLAIGSGFGYYSLSSILIENVKGEVLGVTALIANIMREILTLLFTPIIAKYFGKIAPITLGGATSMDTTLPIITKYVGTEYTIISVFNGTILTILVPFFVSFFLSL